MGMRGGRYHYQSIDTFDIHNSKDGIDTLFRYLSCDRIMVNI